MASPEPALPELAPVPAQPELPELPDLPLHLIFTHATPRELGAISLASKRFSQLTASDVLWRKLCARTLPPLALAHVSTLACPTWRCRHLAFSHVRSLWGGGGLYSPAGAGATIRGPAPATLRAGAGGPMFCVNALAPVAGARPAFLAGGADGRVRLIHVGPRAAAAGEGAGDGGAAPQRGAAGPAPDAFRSWYTSRAAPILEGGAAACRRGLEGAAQEDGAFAHACRLRTAHEFEAHDGGMLGMSCEDTSPPYGPAAVPGPTLITCAFSGHSTLWRVNTREVERLHELPARRLKGLLRARGIPIEGLREKEEFVRLIARANALPVASRLCEFERHAGTVVSASHTTMLGGGGGGGGSRSSSSSGGGGGGSRSSSGGGGGSSRSSAGTEGLAITSSHDGTIKIYRLDEALEREVVRHEEGVGAARGSVPTLAPERTIEAHPGTGCDCAVLERSGGAGEAGAGAATRLSSILSGGKDGYVRQWDIETGQKTWQCFLGDVWVWCLKSRHVLEGGFGEDAGCSAAFAHPQCFLSGCTAGVVRLFDRRIGSCVQAVSAEDGQLDKGYVHGQGALHLGEGRAIAGLSFNPTLNGFISTGFDGRLTVWDARRAMTPLRSWAVAGSADTRLTRAAMLGPDLAVCGGMDGRVYAWDFDWLRATTRADT